MCKAERSNLTRRRESSEMAFIRRDTDDSLVASVAEGEPNDSGSFKMASTVSSDVAGKESVSTFDEMPLQSTLTAELNYITWSEFKHIREYRNRTSHVIDVLVEEPDLRPTLERTSNHWLREVAEQIQADTSLRRRVTDPKQFYSARGQRQLPERIRVNSKALVALMATITGDHSVHVGRPLVIVRPFKPLVFYESKLRAKYEELRAKHHQFDDERMPIQHAHDNESEHSTASVTKRLSQGIQGFRREERKKTRMMRWLPKKSQNVVQPDIEINPGKAGREVNFVESPIALQHLQCLLEFIDTEINERIRFLEADGYRNLFFSDLWHLYKPGDEITLQSMRQIYRVISVKSQGHKVMAQRALEQLTDWWRRDAATMDRIIIRCVYIDFDGRSLGPVSQYFHIDKFDGQKSLTALPFFPLRLSAKSPSRETLISKGRMFPEFIKFKHMQYTGLTLDSRDDVDGQVVIDFEEALATHDRWRPPIENVLEQRGESGETQTRCHADCCANEVVFNESSVDQIQEEGFLASLIPRQRNTLPSLSVYPRTLGDMRNSEDSLTDSDYAIMCRRVFGFVLHSRKWGELSMLHLDFSLKPL